MRTVLVIDDSELIRLAATVGLSSQGWRVLTADDGRAGVDLAVETLPDAVLLDFVMPDFDGAATLQALRERPATRATPVVFLTARADYIDKSDAATPGPAGTIAKPFNPSRLAIDLAELLGWPL